MVINHNMSAMYAQRQTGATNLSTQKSMEKLSSG
ncbi:MAG: flagellin, partial [Spirochaetaceae bacterium]|nr:flagellin [Spirochaetaceae bacterium]